jgi:hypothetical protein
MYSSYMNPLVNPNEAWLKGKKVKREANTISYLLLSCPVGQVTEAVRQARDRRDFQQQLRQGREFTGGMLILLNFWRGICKQLETDVPRAEFYWQGIGKLSSYRDHRVENLLLILIYWRYVDTFAHFG